MKKQEGPILAQTLNLQDYLPAYGDFIIWSGWFGTTYCLVVGYAPTTHTLTAIMSGNPAVLFTLGDSEQTSRTRNLTMEQINQASRGTFAVLRQDKKTNSNVWYI